MKHDHVCMSRFYIKSLARPLGDVGAGLDRYLLVISGVRGEGGKEQLLSLSCRSKLLRRERTTSRYALVPKEQRMECKRMEESIKVRER